MEKKPESDFDREKRRRITRISYAAVLIGSLAEAPVLLYAGLSPTYVLIAFVVAGGGTMVYVTILIRWIFSSKREK